MDGHRTDDAIAVAPHLHEVIFENDRLRVLKVTVKPGDVAEMHWHPENINYVLHGGELQFTKPDSEPVHVVLVTGAVTSSDAGSHAVQNLSDEQVQTIQVELKT